MRVTTWFVFLFGACGGVQNVNTDDTSTAYSAALTVDAAVQESGLIAAIAGKLNTSASAAGDAAGITTLFMPQGCATAQLAASVVTYTFNKCTGPYGLLKLDGTVTAAFTSAAGGKVQVALSASAFKISTVTVNVSATAV